MVMFCQRCREDSHAAGGCSHVCTLKGHVAAITSLAFSPNVLMLASGCAKGWFNIWALQVTGRIINMIHGSFQRDWLYLIEGGVDGV